MSTLLQSGIKNYGYPDIVFEVVSKFVDIVLDVFSKEDVGILLVGSTSRGELCWGDFDQKSILFSDIEFMIVVKSESRQQKVEIAKRVHELSDSYDLGERFHLDYVVNKWSRLKSPHKKIFVFDCKNTGIDLTDYKVKDCLPDVTKENLDFKELNDILLHRMKSLLNDVPANIFENDNECRDFSLSIAKNTLDVTTWLFPYESDGLVSGFKNRIHIWQEKKESLLLSKYLDESDFHFLNECLDIRDSPEKEMENIADFLAKYIRVYNHAIDYCKKMNEIDSNRPLSNNAISNKLFSEYRIKRRLQEAVSILTNYRVFSVNSMLQNIFLPRKGRQIEFCFNMLTALSSHLLENDDAVEHLDYATRHLEKLIRLTECNETGFKDNWLSLKSSYNSLNKVFI